MNWNKNRRKNIDKIVNDFERHDDERFKEALIRDIKIREAKNINERVDVIWLKWDVFIYKQRASLFEMCRFEIQENQKFNRSFVNFRFFDFDNLDSSNLNSLREFNDSFAQDALSVCECKVFVKCKHDNQFAFEFRDKWNKLRDDVNENDYLTILFFHLRHYYLSIRMRWWDHRKNHKMLHDDVNKSDDEKSNENDDESDNENDKKKA